MREQDALLQHVEKDGKMNTGYRIIYSWCEFSPRVTTMQARHAKLQAPLLNRDTGTNSSPKRSPLESPTFFTANPTINLHAPLRCSLAAISLLG